MAELKLIVLKERSNDYCNDYSKRFRISGGEIATDWKQAHEERYGKDSDEIPYCEFTINNKEFLNQEKMFISSYGGSVWPSAWPELFQSFTGSAYTGSFVLLTNQGRVMVKEAVKQYNIDCLT